MGGGDQKDDVCGLDFKCHTWHEWDRILNAWFNASLKVPTPARALSATCANDVKKVDNVATHVRNKLQLTRKFTFYLITLYSC